jgi:hypothetical protein
MLGTIVLWRAGAASRTYRLGIALRQAELSPDGAHLRIRTDSVWLEAAVLPPPPVLVPRSIAAAATKATGKRRRCLAQNTLVL